MVRDMPGTAIETRIILCKGQETPASAQLVLLAGVMLTKDIRHQQWPRRHVMEFPTSGEEKNEPD
jgi:hypothetical protein